MRSEGPERFAALDALRGVAALTIVLRHFPWPDDVVRLFPRSYLAVDLFFALSGFVIAHAYRARLAEGMALKRFVLVRLIRLYPLYIIGSLIGAAVALYQLSTGAAPGGLRQWLITVAAATLFLPPPQRWSFDPSTLYPFDYTAWSLLWELAVNLLYAAVARRLRPWSTASLTLIGAVLLVWLARGFQSIDGGSDGESLWLGAARALFAFFAGVCIHWVRARWPAPRLPAWILPLILLGAMMPSAGTGWRYDIGCVMLLFPGLVWLGADAATGRVGTAVAERLGTLSYPIYVLQMPILALLSLILPWEIGDWVRRDLPIYVAAVLAVSWAVSRWADEPLRHRLSRRIAPGGRPGAETAP